MRKPAFCICENICLDQLCGNRATDQRLCLSYKDSTILLLLNLKFQASSHILRLYSPVCVGPGTGYPQGKSQGKYFFKVREVSGNFVIRVFWI